MKNIIILVGPSGSGKTELAKYIIKKYDAGEFVSTTTRLPRNGEVNHVDYHFVTNEVFEEMIKKNELIEHVTYAGNSYGLTKSAIYDSLINHDICVAVMDIHGASVMKYLFKDDENVKITLVFIHAKVSTLFLRMVNRGDSNEKIAERLDNIFVNKELLNGGSCDYSIFNDTELCIAEKEIDEIIEKKFKK